MIREAFIEAIDTLAKDYQGSSLTDIFITVDKESGEVVFWDDEENRVGEIVIFDWVNKIDELSDETIVASLKTVTEQLYNDNTFDSLDIYKPFSVNYADDNMVVIDELLLINEDSTINLDNSLMEKFDREFDEFLDKLLKE